MEKTNRHNAIGFCWECNAQIYSSGGGIFKSCPCGESYIDQERYEGAYVRCGGLAVLIEQICPSTCKNKFHKGQNRIEDFNELKKYLKGKYNIKIK